MRPVARTHTATRTRGRWPPHELKRNRHVFMHIQIPGRGSSVAWREETIRDSGMGDSFNFPPHLRGRSGSARGELTKSKITVGACRLAVRSNLSL